MLKTSLVVVTLALTACSAGTPPTMPAPRDAAAVGAGFDETWNAVIDHFADDNIPIATIEKASGIVATARLRVGAQDAQRWANCGAMYDRTPYVADGVIYNVLVRGDGQASTVRVTASWTSTSGAFDCVSRGVWEAEAEEAIKARAERR